MGKKHKKHKSTWQHVDEGGLDKTPIKLVLKLGSEVMYDSDYAANSPASTHEASSHRHKKKKKKRHHEEKKDIALTPPEPSVQEEETTPMETEVDVSSPEVSTGFPDDDVSSDVPQHGTIPPKIEPIPKKSPASTTRPRLSHVKRKALNNLLDHLLKQLERKDPHEIFAWPVNDMIAPGYSSVIDNPMDFSTMRNKVLTNQYFNVCEFKEDFEIMIENCCVYNKPDTVYYDIAKKVLAAGRKILSKERLVNMKRTLNFLHDLSKQELSEIFGLSLVGEENVEVSDSTTNGAPQPSTIERPNETPDDSNQISAVEELDLRAHPDAISFTDADNEETVAPDAIHAMKTAQRLLQEKCPNNRIGFLHMDDEGKTTLNILNPEANEPKHREVDLGSLTGSLASGIDVMPEAKEDKRNKVTPLEYLSYGPFGSFAPTYDSRVSNLTKEESDLLLSAYGGEPGYLFAQSIEEFVVNTNVGLKYIVGDLLNTVTHGVHGQATDEIQKKRKKSEQKKTKRAKKRPSTESIKVNFEELETLKDIGIDVSFLKEIQSKQVITQKKGEPDSNVIEKSLNHGSVLLNQLQKEQSSRLSIKPLNDEPNLEPPSTKERKIAAELQKTLSGLTASATPGDVCDQGSVRYAMGIVSTS